jgi:hypothetical protein
MIKEALQRRQRAEEEVSHLKEVEKIRKHLLSLSHCSHWLGKCVSWEFSYCGLLVSFLIVGLAAISRGRFIRFFDHDKGPFARDLFSASVLFQFPLSTNKPRGTRPLS